MPLDRDNEVIGRVQLHGLDHCIAGRNRNHSEIVSGRPDGLMMARVHLHFSAEFAGRIFASREPSAIFTGCASTTSRPGR